MGRRTKENKLNFISGSAEVFFEIVRLENGFYSNVELSDYKVLIRFSVRNEWLDYKRFTSEIMTFGALAEFRDMLNNIFNGKLIEPAAVCFSKPDIMFTILPRFRIKREKGGECDKEYMELQDVFANLILKFADDDGFYTGEKYVLPIYRGNLELLAGFLNLAVPRLERQWESARRRVKTEFKTDVPPKNPDPEKQKEPEDLKEPEVNEEDVKETDNGDVEPLQRVS